MPKQILVLGLHRSGTSALAGLLHHLGVFMGDNLQGASKDNPKGHFEDATFQKLLHMLVGNWEEPHHYSVKKRHIEIARRLIQRRDRKHSVWGVKDPRLCFGAGYFFEHLSNPYVVTIERPFEESVRSLIARDKMPRPVAEYILSRYYINKRYTQNYFANNGAKVFGLTFNYLCANPEDAVHQIVERVGITPTEEQRQNAIAFIDPNLRHQRV